MGQHTDLGWNGPVLLDFLKPAQNLSRLFRGIRHRVQTDDRVPRAEAQALQGGGGNALRVIGGVVGLQAAAQRTGKPDGGIAVGRYGDFGSGIDEVQIAHQLAHRRHHFGGQPPAEPVNIPACGVFIQDIFPQVGHRPALDFFILGKIQVVLDDAGNLVRFIGNRRILPQLLQGHPGKHHLGGNALLGAFRCQARQLVSGLHLVCLGKHLFQVPKLVCFPQKGGFQFHRSPSSRPPRWPLVAARISA